MPKLLGWFAGSACALLVASAICGAQRDAASECRRVADMLDRFVQPRFLQDDGRFGGSRVVATPGHAAANLAPVTQKERALVQEVAGLHHSYRVDLIEIVHAKADPKSRPSMASRSSTAISVRPGDARLLPLVMSGAAFASGAVPRPNTRKQMTAMSERLGSRMLALQQQQESFRKAAQGVMPGLKQGKPQDVAVNGWLVSLRPVRAVQQCIRCHVGGKPGDTMGVMSYAVREAKDPPSKAADHGPAPSRMRP